MNLCRTLCPLHKRLGLPIIAPPRVKLPASRSWGFRGRCSGSWPVGAGDEGAPAPPDFTLLPWNLSVSPSNPTFIETSLGSVSCSLRPSSNLHAFGRRTRYFEKYPTVQRESLFPINLSSLTFWRLSNNLQFHNQLLKLLWVYAWVVKLQWNIGGTFCQCHFPKVDTSVQGF